MGASKSFRWVAMTLMVLVALVFTVSRDEVSNAQAKPQVVALSAGINHSLALKPDGTVWAWGYNSDGELGDGKFDWQSAPVQVFGLSDVVAIAAGYYHSLALKSDGSVWAWGDNKVGQLGDGTLAHALTPVPVSGLKSVTAIAAGGYHSLALSRDGRVWIWGWNDFGQLGIGSNDGPRPCGSGHCSAIPVEIPGLDAVIAIAGGEAFSLALRSDGTMRAWGWNDYGQLGQGSRRGPENCGGSLPIACSRSPVRITSLSQVIAIAAGQYHALALRDDGTVWSWGFNQFGELGYGKIFDIDDVPVQVPGLTHITAIAAKAYNSRALGSDGSLWAWGINEFGELGIGENTGPYPWCSGALPCSFNPVQVLHLGRVATIASGAYHSLAVLSDGSVWAWGLNEAGQLGIGSNNGPDECVYDGIDHPCSLTPVPVQRLVLSNK